MFSSLAHNVCGQGGAACMLAETFPGATVHGCDYHAGSIDVASDMARRRGLRNVTFAVASSDAFGSDASFDLLCFLDMARKMCWDM